MAHGAQKAELWARWQKHDPGSAQKIDHSAWDGFLKKFVVVSDPSGINRVRYQAVAAVDFKSLQDYLRSMQAVAISNYNRNEQKAFWINVYNALTIDVVLSRFPVVSIRTINISPELLAQGPWGAKLFIVEGEKLSLDDIEHRILRPIWKDNRVHYAVNAAALGSPNLQPLAFTGENTEALLEKGAREFINHPRGVDIEKNRLQVSSIYVWFQEDFGRDAEDLMEHWQQYANPKLTDAKLEKYNGGLTHDFDWRLNKAQSEALGRCCGPDTMNISVVLPVLNEEQSIRGTLQSLIRLTPYEIIVVDGGSRDRTLEICKEFAVDVMHADRGRARQMNVGARRASGEVLLFLHADTRLPAIRVARYRHSAQRLALSWRPFRCRAGRRALDAQNRRSADQLSLARDPSRDRRSGAVCPARSF